MCKAILKDVLYKRFPENKKMIKNSQKSLKKPDEVDDLKISVDGIYIYIYIYIYISI